MSIQDLERRRLIQRVPPSVEEARRQLDLSRRDVSTASRLVAIDLDWALIAAYNGALQAGIAHMQAQGYRARGPEKHKAVLSYLRETLPGEMQAVVSRLDRLRRKRHQAVYESAGIVSEQEAKTTVQLCREFVDRIANLVGSP